MLLRINIFSLFSEKKKVLLELCISEKELDLRARSAHPNCSASNKLVV